MRTSTRVMSEKVQDEQAAGEATRDVLRTLSHLGLYDTLVCDRIGKTAADDLRARIDPRWSKGTRYVESVRNAW